MAHNHIFIVRCIFFVLFFSQSVSKGQSALGQLQTMAGQSVSSVYVPTPSSPSSGGTYRPPFQKTYEQKQAEAADHYQRAVSNMNSGDWGDAVRLLRKAVRKDPYNNNYKQKLAQAERELDRQRQSDKARQEQEKNDAELRRQREEEQRRIEAKRLERERVEQEAIRKKMEEAEDLIMSYKKDIKFAQGQLKNYSKALQTNSNDIDALASEIDKAYNNTIESSKGYLTNMFIKYNMLQGILKRSYVQQLYDRTGNLYKSSNPEIQKWFAKETKNIGIRIDKVQDVIDRVMLGYDLYDILNTDKNTAAENLKILMFLNSTMETAHINKYDKLIKEIEKPFGWENMPGEYFEQAKMIGEVYSDIAAMGYSWFQIRKLNKSNEEMAQQVQVLSAGMEQRMDQIDCLKKCMKNYTDRCIEKCSGKTRWSTPPPPLLFPN